MNNSGCSSSSRDNSHRKFLAQHKRARKIRWKQTRYTVQFLAQQRKQKWFVLKRRCVENCRNKLGCNSLALKVFWACLQGVKACSTHPWTILASTCSSQLSCTKNHCCESSLVTSLKRKTKSKLEKFRKSQCNSHQQMNFYTSSWLTKKISHNEPRKKLILRTDFVALWNSNTFASSGWGICGMAEWFIVKFKVCQFRFNSRRVAIRTLWQL